jgi:hypothetical protein
MVRGTAVTVGSVVIVVLALAYASLGLGPSRTAEGLAIFTPAALAASNTTGHLLLAILGDVFDVTRGKQHYAPGQSYAHFTGRDASRAFTTGASDDEGLTDSHEGLGLEELKAIDDWHQFYVKHDKYRHVGVLVGRYYDGAGKRRPAAFPWDEIARHATLQNERKQRMPQCNSKWTQAEGSTVWCTTRSGGVQREWTGVPRLYTESRDPTFSSGTGLTAATGSGGAGGGASAERCVCVQAADLLGETPHLRAYPGCESDATTCVVRKTE